MAAAYAEPCLSFPCKSAGRRPDPQGTVSCNATTHLSHATTAAYPPVV